MKNLKNYLIYGIVFLVTYIIILTLSLFVLSKYHFCITCAILLYTINFFPLLILNIEGYSAYIISSIFYFVVGCFFGYLYHKLNNYFKWY